MIQFSKIVRNHIVDEGVPSPLPLDHGCRLLRFVQRTVLYGVGRQLLQRPQVAATAGDADESLVEIIAQRARLEEGRIVGRDDQRDVLGEVGGSWMITQIVDQFEDLQEMRVVVVKKNSRNY